MPMKNDDRRLARLAGQGDQDAFALLVERYSGLVYTLALRRVGRGALRQRIAAALGMKTASLPQPQVFADRG